MNTDPKILSGEVCPYCGNDTTKCNDAVIYGRTFGGMVYMCLKCDSYVGCHKRPPYEALGRLANADLREEKIKAHAAFDPLWRKKMLVTGLSKAKARGEAYKWLAKQMNIDPQYCHIGYMDIPECRQVVKICTPYLK